MRLIGAKTPLPPLVLHQMASAAVSMVVAQLLIAWVPLVQGFWVPLTALVVSLTITSSSAAFRRGFQRVLGTMCGVALGSCGILLIDHTAIFLILLVLTGTLAYWSKCLSRYYGLFVCLITTLVAMLLASFFNHQRPLLWTLLSYRLIDTLCGALVAYLCSLLIMPRHQHDQVFATLTGLLRRIAGFNRSCLLAAGGEWRVPEGAFFHHFEELEHYVHGNLPIWSYDLLFDRYIYARFQLFTHRISRLMLTLNLLHSLTTRLHLAVDDPWYRALCLNSVALTGVIDAIVALRLDLARRRLRRLERINRLIGRQALAASGEDGERRAQVSALLLSIEHDVAAMLNGVSLTFLCDKAREDRRLHLPPGAHRRSGRQA
ncbi:FUSC family protein [Edwardsiella anguillarum]|uniref:FUSC family protein n=1 Tax=Edwardsiella anguillarum TaxID=1821960 RepID=UPI0024B788F5|nr:FUSC family protein [Edwardsiella anguillarum]WHP79830.1 FUSC family protein [Edwardsiella anguillarum]WHQ17290.1 FUSC family protein [Edwardsiella anguillarum]WHQ20826.1 FUSC family protein [Edwardsiella anguillarum]WHQ24348.1 FUSC family protein [Edwardsiella anguillarum]WHQ27918.1 FUSC family protein [Edwardsiella anguillarum]